MTENPPQATDPPAGDRVGNDYSQGSNPAPGGETDVEGRTVPPYDDRSEGNEERAAGVPRAMGTEEPLEEPVQPGSDLPPDENAEDKLPPKGVGESTTTRGEDIGDGDDEAGREDTGTSGESGRPTGESTPRDRTGVDPHDSNVDHGETGKGEGA